MTGARERLSYCKVCNRRFGGKGRHRVRRSDPKYHDPNKCADCKAVQQREYQARYRDRIIAQQIAKKQEQDRAAIADMKFTFRSLTCEWSGGQFGADNELIIRLDEGEDRYLAILLPMQQAEELSAWLERTKKRQKSK